MFSLLSLEFFFKVKLYQWASSSKIYLDVIEACRLKVTKAYSLVLGNLSSSWLAWMNFLKIKRSREGDSLVNNLAIRTDQWVPCLFPAEPRLARWPSQAGDFVKWPWKGNKVWNDSLIVNVNQCLSHNCKIKEGKSCEFIVQRELRSQEATWLSHDARIS